MLAIGSVEPRIAAVNLQAQTGSATQSFEVASIRLNRSGSGNFARHAGPGGRFTATNETVAQLMDLAYALGDSRRAWMGSGRITGGPAWIFSDRYDIIATAGREVTGEETRAMLRALLIERFKLAVHLERKEHPTYALVLARTDGRLGRQMRRTDVDCQAIAAALKKFVDGKGPRPGKVANGAQLCSVSAAAGELKSGGVTIDDLAVKISQDAGRTVVNKTGLSGNYEFTLTYSVPGAAENAAADNRSSIFVALREQLGLKLEAQQNPLEFLVIDRIQHPTPN
jgi:uncharacterized protein (TIGR03435 family)